MAVPVTRIGASDSSFACSSLIGSADSASRSVRMLRPRFQVVMIVNTNAATTSGNQPPLGIFVSPAVQKPRSNTRNAEAIAIVAGRLHFHNDRDTTASRMVVNTMSVVTATPYAAARLLDDRNPTTSPTHATASSQLRPGM